MGLLSVQLTGLIKQCRPPKSLTLLVRNGRTVNQLSRLVSNAPEQQMMKNHFAALSERQVKCHELSDLHLAVADRNGQIANLN